ncbi:MAG: major facilitator transporter [Bacillales bacterium]|nr:major facilitator transporter [Bacillales bacterium]
MVSENKHKNLLIFGLLLGIFAAAIDNTIVATAMPTIVGDLGGSDKFVWVTSAYIVMVMAGMPIFGKLSDMYGRKKFFLFGLSVFLIGSMLCGLAQSIIQLSIFRAIQGIGGGALMPIAFTIVFDIFPPQQRGKMTAALGAVFGLSSVIGPLLGAIITDAISWHWIFYVNVPIVAISMLLIIITYHESNQHAKQNIDWFGAITLVIGVIALMFALELGGKEFAWDSLQSFLLFGTFAIMFLIFILVERKAKDPIISFWMFKNRLFASSQALAFFYGAAFLPLTVFVPIIISAKFGGSSIDSSLVLTPMMLGSVAGSASAGFSQTKFKFRNIILVSLTAFLAGMFFMSTVTPETSRTLITFYMILCGYGIGFNFSLLPTTSMHHIDARHRGSANSTNQFFRTLGMTIGISIFGSIQSNILSEKLSDAFKGMGNGAGLPTTMKDPSQMFKPEVRKMIPTEILNKIIHAIFESITPIFTICIFIIAIAFIAAFFMGNERIVMMKKEESKSE